MAYFTNPKQRENLAQFYSNFGLAVLSFGFIGPVFTGIEISLVFILKLILAFVFTLIVLDYSLRFLK
jgi:hypothetical protein